MDDVRRNETTRFFVLCPSDRVRISKIVVDIENRAVKYLALSFALSWCTVVIHRSRSILSSRDTYFPPSEISAFHHGENSVRTNERLAAVKRQTRRFKGWMHLTLKEPHSAPLSCVIFQPVQAYSSPPNQRCNTADVARITRNLPHYSPFRKNLFAYARRVTPMFFLTLTHSVGKNNRPTDLKFEKKKNRADVIA